MLPYFSYTELHVGPITIHVWGLMVALGILAGVWLIKRRAREFGLKTQPFEEAAFWLMLFAFLGARIGHILFYGNAADILSYFKIWEGGWSSMGGIIGAVCAALWLKQRGHFKNLKQTKNEAGDDGEVHFGRVADILLSGFPLGMAIGRVGCFLIHDHPGTLSHSLLAVNFPESLGGPRHDLGLYEAIAMFALALVLALAWNSKSQITQKLKAKEGAFALRIAASYALIRFLLDFLRADDPRYLGLTTAQFLCLGLLVFCAVKVYKK